MHDCGNCCEGLVEKYGARNHSICAEPCPRRDGKPKSVAVSVYQGSTLTTPPNPLHSPDISHAPHTCRDEYEGGQGAVLVGFCGTPLHSIDAHTPHNGAGRRTRSGWGWFCDTTNVSTSDCSRNSAAPIWQLAGPQRRSQPRSVRRCWQAVIPERGASGPPQRGAWRRQRRASRRACDALAT